MFIWNLKFWPLINVFKYHASKKRRTFKWYSRYRCIGEIQTVLNKQYYHYELYLPISDRLQSEILKAKTTNNTEYSEYIHVVPLSKQTVCQTFPDINDWTFQCSVPCNEIKPTDMTRIDVIKSCPVAVGVTWSRVADKTLFHIPYQSRCLDNLINDYCQTSNVVPSIAHYVWFSKREMTFYHFLSFISVLKHLKPCLLLIHGDVPYGLYWEYILTIADNIVNVKMEPPTTIFGIKIGCVEHQADVTRLLVLRGNDKKNHLL
jgi:hypothetical protein